MGRYRKITIDESQKDSPLVGALAGAEIVKETPQISNYQTGKRHLHLSRKKGDAFDLCASAHPKYICCNTHVLKSLSNCPLQCSYCFLQNYLTNSTTTVVVDTGALIQEVKEKTSRQPWRFFRVGTWELGDSLALEPVVSAAAELIEAFSKIPNALLKLRTKTDYVDSLLDLDHRGRTVISWTVNPDKIIREEETLTATLSQRLLAMEKVAKAGYLVGLHFDPMVIFDGWEDAYEDLVKRIFQSVPPERICWISIGSVRFNPEMKKTLETNYPTSRITAAEMVLGDDNKFRYIRPLRVQLYRHLRGTEAFDQLFAKKGEKGGTEPFVYLCMERWNVWEEVFGSSPRSSGHLDYLITRSLEKRYPGLVHQSPNLALYESI